MYVHRKPECPQLPSHDKGVAWLKLVWSSVRTNLSSYNKLSWWVENFEDVARSSWIWFQIVKSFKSSIISSLATSISIRQGTLRLAKWATSGTLEWASATLFSGPGQYRFQTHILTAWRPIFDAPVGPPSAQLRI